MAAQDQSLSQIAKHVSNLGNVANSFKTAANQHNGSIAKVIKDIGNIFASNRMNFSSISSSIDSQSSQMQQTSSKIDATNNLLQQSITIQSGMLNSLKDIKRSLEEKDKKDDKKEGGGIVDTISSAIMGGISKIPAARWIGAGLGAVGTAAAGYGAYKSDLTSRSTRDPGSASPGGGPALDPSKFQDPRTNNEDLDPDVLKRYEGRHLPASIRLNNMGAMSLSAPGKNPFVENMPGYVGATPRPANEGGFYAQYATPVHGVAAASKNLENYGQKGIDTPDAIVAKWTNGKPNPTYSSVLQRYLGEGTTGTTKLNLSDPSVRMKILMAKSEVESGAGKPVYKEHVYQRGVNSDFTQVKAGATQPGATSANAGASTGQGITPEARQPGATSANAGASTGQGITPEARQPDQQNQRVSGGDISALTKFNNKGPSNIEGMKPDFASKLSSFLQAAQQAGNPIRINSGYRTPERQAELYEAAVRKYGSEKAARKWVAPPGRSNHNKGLAADLSFSSDKAKEWAHQNASKFGLNFRMAHEAWHIEPKGSHGNEGGQEGNVASRGGRMMGEPMMGMGSPLGLGGPMGGGMGMGSPLGLGGPMGGGMGMGASPLGMIGGMLGGGMGGMGHHGVGFGAGMALGNLAGAAISGLSGLFGGGEERTPVPSQRRSFGGEIEENALEEETLKDRARQSSMRANQQRNEQQNQQTAGNQSGQNSFKGNEYNGPGDLRISDNSFFGDLMRSGMYKESMSGLQLSA